MDEDVLEISDEELEEFIKILLNKDLEKEDFSEDEKKIILKVVRCASYFEADDVLVERKYGGIGMKGGISNDTYLIYSMYLIKIMQGDSEIKGASKWIGSIFINGLVPLKIKLEKGEPLEKDSIENLVETIKATYIPIWLENAFGYRFRRF